MIMATEVRWYAIQTYSGHENKVKKLIEHRIAEEAGKDGVVLLCFENVLAGERCHRQQVAAWLERITGNRVEELGSAVPA